LNATADAGDAASELVYTLTTAPAHGTLKLSGTALTAGGTFTQDDVNTRNGTYTSDATSSGPDDTDSFAFSVADAPGAAAAGTFAITVTEAAATVTTNTGLSVPEGTTATLTTAELNTTSDPGDPASELLYTLTAVPAHGTLKLSGGALAVGGTFTQADV